jgi:hypothetical protein
VSLPKDTVPDPHADPLVASAMRAAAAGQAAGCPDADLLGLYAEQALSGDAKTRLESHVQGCGRCQAIVAALVRTLPEWSGAGAQPDTVHGGFTSGFAAWFAGGRWLVPATSLAAVALMAVWIGRGPGDEVAESARMARELPAPTIGAEPGAPAAATPATTPAELDFAQSASPKRDAPSDAGAAVEAPAPAAPVTPGRTLAATRSGTQSRATSADELANAPRTAPLPAPSAALASERAELGRSGQEVTGGARAKAAAPAEARQDASDRLADRRARADDAASAAKPTAREAAAENEVARLEESVAVSPPPPTAVAPSAASAPADAASTFRSGVAAPAWRASGGVVERSRDHGQTWQPVPTPAGVRAIAVASVAPDVCWAISADAVLRTTDGVTWTRTLRPSTQALQSIAATSALAATVTTASGRRLVTSDGGASWAPVP